jgi:hypothetical protein
VPTDNRFTFQHLTLMTTALAGYDQSNESTPPQNSNSHEPKFSHSTAELADVAFAAAAASPRSSNVITGLFLPAFDSLHRGRTTKYASWANLPYSEMNRL